MLQIYHFAFGFGGLLSPIVAEPFLSTQPSRDDLHRAFSNGTLGASSSPTATTMISTVALSHISVPYGIIAATHFVLAVSKFVFFSVDSSDYKPCAEESNYGSLPSNAKRCSLLGCLSLYLMFYDTLENSMSQMLATFSVKSSLRFTKSQASYLSSLYWTTFTVSRALAALWAVVSTPKTMMLTEHGITLAALGVFWWFGETSAVMVCVCAAMVGVGTAGMFATAITWTVSTFIFSLVLNRERTSSSNSVVHRQRKRCSAARLF